MDILIRAKRENVEHKFKENVIADNPDEDPEELYCYWTGINPKQKPLGKVMFTDGNTVYGEARILGVTEWNGLEFKPLKRVDYPQPKKAPTRGFTYVN
jgi:hypothetical protein